MKDYSFDVIVVGAGHAGTEAALASARMGCRTALITLSKRNLGMLSCNPAIGGLGKGQLVKEIDALGGEMAKAADYAGIQFRMLNASKGAAVQSSRVQIDREMYKKYMTSVFELEKNISIIEGKVVNLVSDHNSITGVELASGETLCAKAVIITPGTFLNGKIHIGLTSVPGGRIGEESVTGIADYLKQAGFNLLRFKTGTCARLDSRTIDFSKLEVQEGDREPQPFSFTTTAITNKQVPCYITYTNKQTHDIIRSGLDRSPLYSGVITGTGVRYCPSIEDKIMRFSDRDRHQIFLEPEGLTNIEIYPNGLSTSLPEDVQVAMFHSIPGLENVSHTTLGYGIEHDVVEPTQLFPTLETKRVKNLYCAGQINGTTGYEEAGAQGLIAGINAALNALNREPLILDRSTSYIGVLIDDLVTKGTNEPYRMFTSRVEYRLLLREDNADRRLAHIGYKLGLISDERYKAVEEKERTIKEKVKALRKVYIQPTPEIKHTLKTLELPPLTRAVSMEAFMCRPGVTISHLYQLGADDALLPSSVIRDIEIEIKYSGYIKRHLRDIKKFQNLEKIKLSKKIDYTAISGLSREIQEKLSRIKPVCLGQASRISGVTPAAIMLLMVYLKKMNAKKS